MHEKKIPKFQNAGTIQLTYPGTQNTGFNFSQKIANKALTPKQLQLPNWANPIVGSNTFQQSFPTLDVYARNGDPLANKIKADFDIQQGLADINKIKNIIDKPTTFRTNKNGNQKQDFATTKTGKGIALGSQIVGMASQFIPDQDKDVNEVDATLKQTRGMAQQGLMSSGNPWLMAAGATDMFIDKLGGHSDASQGLGLGTDIMNGVASFIPGAGWLAGKTDKYSQSDMIKRSSSYTGEAEAGKRVARNAGAKLLFGRSKANDATRNQKLRDINTEGVLADAKNDFWSSMYQGTSIGDEMLLRGGPRDIRLTKLGGKLQQARDLLNNISDDVKSFKEGGKVNVIPAGQLHKNKHHMEEVSDDFKDLTSKGIPVVTEKEDGELVQQAEIERDEIIFNIDVTKKLEELMEDGSDDAALEAGKLLAAEIMENTIDNTGLMQELS